MKIDRELIQRAKEELGDRNGDLIAEALGAEQWNPATRKCLCPWHDDHKPSASYNPKDYTLHCFACGHSSDIIGAYMNGQGMTFTQACAELFKEAEMRVPMDIVRKDSSYKYPHEELAPSEDVYHYLELRKISRDTVNTANIGSDENGNIVFNYYNENDVLLMCKYRPSHKVDKSKESKSWSQKGADTKPILFNMNRVNPNLPLAITEGEIDSLAVMECGFHNVVSVPFGCGSLKWIDENYEWLEQFKEIILCGDNDEPGQKMNKEVASRLGEYRCKTLVIPDTYVDEESGKEHKIKDCNEVLYWYGKEVLYNLLVNAKDTEIESIMDMSDVDYVSIQDMQGVKSGIAPLDKEIEKFVYGSLILITGAAGAGKSSLITQLMCGVLDDNDPIWVMSLEMNEAITKDWYLAILAGRHNIDKYESSSGSPYYKVKRDKVKAINDHYRGQWKIYKNSYDSDIDTIIDSATQSYKKYGTKAFVFDNLMVINTNGADDEFVQQGIIVKKLVQFAQKYGVLVFLICHPKKTMAGTNLGLSDISGTSKIGNLAMLALTLRRVTEDEKNDKGFSKLSPELKQYDVILEVVKNRYTGRQGKKIGMWYDNASRRFYTSPEELYRQYKWDTEEHPQGPWEHYNDAEFFGYDDAE